MDRKPILQALDPDITDRIAPALITRRSAIARGANASAAMAMGVRVASVPVALAAAARAAFAQGGLPQALVDVLNFALTLEFLEGEFYVTGVATSGLIPPADLAIFTTIRDHEVAHANFLMSVLGSAAVAKPTFDYTAGNGSNNGPFADVFSNYATFLGVAQAFEDTGVRAFKGQAPALQPFDTFLQTALTIHSIEARHASEVRRLRGNFSETAPNEGWITRNITDIPGTAASYAGEENTVHGGVDATAVTSVSVDEVTEAFDEPLTRAQVLAIVDPFIV